MTDLRRRPFGVNFVEALLPNKKAAFSWTKDDEELLTSQPKCEHELLIASYNVKEFQSCSVCMKTDASFREKLRSNLNDNHFKEALADLIVDSIGINDFQRFSDYLVFQIQ